MGQADKGRAVAELPDVPEHVKNHVQSLLDEKNAQMEEVHAELRKAQYVLFRK